MDTRPRRQGADQRPDVAPLAEALARLLAGLWLAKHAEGGEAEAATAPAGATHEPDGPGQ